MNLHIGNVLVWRVVLVAVVLLLLAVVAEAYEPAVTGGPVGF